MPGNLFLIEWNLPNYKLFTFAICLFTSNESINRVKNQCKNLKSHSY